MHDGHGEGGAAKKLKYTERMVKIYSLTTFSNFIFKLLNLMLRNLNEI